MIEIRWNPSVREQRQFAMIWLPAFFAAIGAVVFWRTQWLTLSMAIWGVGLFLTLIAFFIPAVRRPLYVAWMCAAFPIGWTVSHIILVIVFYLVLTPIGILMRLVGRDPMARRFDPTAKTYWITRKAERKTADYFRQY